MSAGTGAAVRSRELYRGMARIRAFEEAAYRAYEAGEVTGTVHASIGQEAVAVGVISELTPADVIVTHHRGHGHALIKGVDPARLFAELLGRGDGVSGGKGGSMHAADLDVGFMGSLAVVGGSIPLAVGVGLAAKRRGEDIVAVAFFGDGAVNQGVLYESMNLAAIWDLPVLFVCENNGYAISVRNHYATSGGGIVPRARGFDLAAEQVDGQNVTEVAAVAETMIKGVRAGRPAVIEALTYRLVGHSRGDPPHGLYRSKDEVDEWHERDPLAVLAEEAGLSESECDPIRAEEQERIDEAVATARQAPEPPLTDAMTEVWGS